MANTCICPHEAGKALHFLDRKRWHIPNINPFPKAVYRPLSVKCLNSTLRWYNIDDSSGGSGVGI